MAATKAPDAPTPTDQTPTLEEFYDVSEAAVLLKLRDPDDTSARGEKWLRDGYNRPSNGSKGRQFPGRYMAGRLKFTAADLAVIAEIALEESEAKRLARETAKPRPSTGRPRRLRKTPAFAGA
ncbi:hypothetical protein [Streptomyces sp. NPDC055733]